jgi:hypothetical protein
MSLSADFDALYERMVNIDRRMARRAGQHIDSMQAGLDNLQELSTPEPAALPPAAIPAGTLEGFMQCTTAELKDLAKRFKVPRRSTCAKHIKGRGKDKALERRRCLALLMVEHNVPALTYDNLLNFYFATING